MTASGHRLILGIESSCDETAVAILRDGRELLASEISSQVDEHARFGGVVPEVASRQHLAALFPLLDRAVSHAGIRLSDIDAVAVTRAPGLIGALLVGVSAAKAIAYALDIPVIGVNHLEAHLLAAQLQEPAPEFPILGLIVSGGHTALYRIESVDSFSLLGNTRDDAAGEAFDKVAKLMGLGYPGGMAIQKLAEKGNAKAYKFPRPLSKKDTLDFSFSGLKTAMRVQLGDTVPNPDDLPDLCASFQEAVADTLVSKAIRAATKYHLRNWVIAGGVAANARLREMAATRAKKKGIALFLPPIEFCVDNAAMVAVAGHHRFARGRVDDLKLNAKPNEDRF